jgi:hypothetical protein
MNGNPRQHSHSPTFRDELCNRSPLLSHRYLSNIA